MLGPSWLELPSKQRGSTARTVHWYNKHGQLVEQIRLNAVHEHLSEIKPSQAMKILYDLDQQAKDTLTDPTGWIINQAKLRKQANETKGKGDGKGEKDSDRDHKGNNKTEGKAEAASKDAVPEWRSQKSEELDEKNSKSGNKGAGKGKADEGEEQETDEFRAKMKRTINWYNRHGGLLAPIRFQEVIQTLGMTDPRVAMRILNDLDQANAEAVLQDPTKWIIEECRRHLSILHCSWSGPSALRPSYFPAEAACGSCYGYLLRSMWGVPFILVWLAGAALPPPFKPFSEWGRQWPPVACRTLPFQRIAYDKTTDTIVGSRGKSLFTLPSKDLLPCSGLASSVLHLVGEKYSTSTYCMSPLPGGSLALGRNRGNFMILPRKAIAAGAYSSHELTVGGRIRYPVVSMLLLRSGELLVSLQDGMLYVLQEFARPSDNDFRTMSKPNQCGNVHRRLLIELPSGEVLMQCRVLAMYKPNRTSNRLQALTQGATWNISSHAKSAALTTQGFVVVVAVYTIESYWIDDLETLPGRRRRFLQPRGRWRNWHWRIDVIASLQNGGLVVANGLKLLLFDPVQIPSLRRYRLLPSSGVLICLHVRPDGYLVVGGTRLSVFSPAALAAGAGPDMILSLTAKAVAMASLTTGALAVATELGTVDFYMDAALKEPIRTRAELHVGKHIDDVQILDNWGVVAVGQCGLKVFTTAALSTGGVALHSVQFSGCLRKRGHGVAVQSIGDLLAVAFATPIWQEAETGGMLQLYRIAKDMAQPKLIGRVSFPGDILRTAVLGDYFLVASTYQIFDGALRFYSVDALTAGAAPEIEITFASVIYSVAALTTTVLAVSLQFGGVLIVDVDFEQRCLRRIAQLRVPDGSPSAVLGLPDGAGVAVAMGTSIAARRSLYWEGLVAGDGSWRSERPFKQEFFQIDLQALVGKAATSAECRNNFSSWGGSGEIPPNVTLPTYQSTIQDVHVLPTGLLVGSHFFDWDGAKSKCSSGEYSPEGEVVCQPCRHGWLSTVGQGGCTYMTWLTFSAWVALPMACVLAGIALIVGRGVQPIQLQNPVVEEEEAGGSTTTTTTTIIAVFEMDAGSVAARASSRLGVEFSLSRMAALGGSVCLVVAVFLLPPPWDVESLGILTAVGTLLGLLILPSQRQRGHPIRRLLTPFLMILLMLQAEILFRIAEEYSFSNESVTLLGFVATSNKEYWTWVSLHIGICLAILAAEILRQQGCQDLPTEAKVLEGKRSRMPKVLLPFYVRVHYGMATGMLVHLIAGASDAYTMVIFAASFEEVTEEQLNAQRQVLIFTTLLISSFSLLMHVVAMLSTRYGNVYPWLLAFEDRHLRGSVTCRFLLLFFKLIYLLLPNERNMNDCSGGPPCDVEYAWACYGEGYCPDACVKGMQGGSCVVAMKDPQELQCVCIGVRPIRKQVALSTLISIVVICGMTCMRIGRLWKCEAYLKTPRPRAGLVAYIVLALGPQIWLLGFTVFLILSNPTLNETSYLLMALTVGFVSLLPAVMLANECKWTLASWAPPQTESQMLQPYRSRNALRLGASGAPALRGVSCFFAAAGAVWHAQHNSLSPHLVALLLFLIAVMHGLTVTSRLTSLHAKVAGDKGAPNSQTSGTRVSATNEVPQPKPLALSKLGGLTAVPTRLGPPKKDAAAAVPAGSP
eukprot:s2303_g5.t14